MEPEMDLAAGKDNNRSLADAGNKQMAEEKGGAVNEDVEHQVEKEPQGLSKDEQIQSGSIDSVKLNVQNEENDSEELRDVQNEDDFAEHMDVETEEEDVSDDHQTLIDIASSEVGDVKVSLRWLHPKPHDFKFPEPVEARRLLEFHSQNFYMNLGSHFSLVELLNELCDEFRESVIIDGGHRSSESREDDARDNPEGMELREETMSSAGSCSDGKQLFHKLDDIANGTENVKIMLIDEAGTEALPHFIYCPENITYKSANVRVSLAHISAEDCCKCGKGICVLSGMPCACAHDSSGGYTYTSEGLLTGAFLGYCIIVKVGLEDKFYCRDCPLEQAEDGGATKNCKGHQPMRFTKECWRKCNCSMSCGNRVVQLGITRKLQVFLTSEGKGWGLRTLEKLPAGAFVCEYAGEILTNREKCERNEQNAGNEKHEYQVLLDGGWNTEGVLRDEDALWLDATHYGNVGRFINHSCCDANIIGIPVQVESLDKKYYHLAFFTMREVEVKEELTWDYGIDFDEDTDHIRPFQCCCGCDSCRDRHRQSP
ncbi:histone-lysine N-methyltransferase SUVR4-like [Andrographis paniculata]|uniref:histone-lysine N-methyltransferase SUVR4-like n=1 Tax=Andrographis paniculata TaxID=175694 RepID=UPI0021E73A2E|nr:histone-lysine N-methyltransferase SUVR4-like [Andrographis paniculata]